MNKNCIECNYEDFCAAAGPSCDDVLESADFDHDEIQDAEFPEKDKHRAQTRRNDFRNRANRTSKSTKPSASDYHKREKKHAVINAVALKSHISEYLAS